MVEKRTDMTIKCLRTDNGGEFTLEFEKYCKNEGIVRHKTNVYTPQQNGVATHEHDSSRKSKEHAQ